MLTVHFGQVTSQVTPSEKSLMLFQRCEIIPKKTPVSQSLISIK